MSMVENSQILREAPNLVEYGIKKGYIRRPVNQIEHLGEYFAARKFTRKKKPSKPRDPFA